MTVARTRIRNVRPKLNVIENPDIARHREVEKDFRRHAVLIGSYFVEEMDGYTIVAWNRAGSWSCATRALHMNRQMTETFVSNVMASQHIQEEVAEG